MADPANIMKLLQTLGGSADYAQGSMAKKNGQPMLQKPAIAAPDLMSPYAPGNQQGGAFAHMGGHATQANGTPAPNSNAKPNEMPDVGAQHPLNQLAQYLATDGGRSATAVSARRGTDPAMFIRGGAGMRQPQPNSPVSSVRG